MKEEPLVSICIPNYNYGKYLRNCLDSILAQTYQNIEVLFRDNASTDNSMDIARSYEEKFMRRGINFYIFNNKRNVGSEENSCRLMRSISGKYVYVLASDDAIEPTMVEKCVKVFEEYPSVGIVMTNRVEMDDDGKYYDVPPFYNCNCVIPGDKQAAVFMMSGVAIPGQRMVKAGVCYQTKNYKKRYQVAGDWFNNYLYICCNDAAYITEPLCKYRVHFGNETSESEMVLLGVMEHYKLINDFYEMAINFRQKEAMERYDEAVKKLGQMCLRYATRYLKHDMRDVASKYITLAPFFDVDIVHTSEYIKLKELSEYSDDALKDYIRNHDLGTVRKTAYDPPEGSIVIEFSK